MKYSGKICHCVAKAAPFSLQHAQVSINLPILSQSDGYLKMTKLLIILGRGLYLNNCIFIFTKCHRPQKYGMGSPPNLLQQCRDGEGWAGTRQGGPTTPTPTPPKQPKKKNKKKKREKKRRKKERRMSFTSV